MTTPTKSGDAAFKKYRADIKAWANGTRKKYPVAPVDLTIAQQTELWKRVNRLADAWTNLDAVDYWALETAHPALARAVERLIRFTDKRS